MIKLLTVAALAAAPAAAYAEAPAAPTAPAAAETTEAPAAAPAAEAAPAAVTDAELDMFAAAAIAVNEIAQNAALTAEEKQTAMVEAVQSSGLAPEKFNEIATKSQTDETMKTRVAEAFARRPAPAAPATEAEPEEQAGG